MKKHKRRKRTAEAGAPGEERRARILYLQDALAACPVDIRARYELAALLEDIGRPDEALFNWRTILASHPNSLMAREGVARCREQLGRILSGMIGDVRITDVGRC